MRKKDTPLSACGTYSWTLTRRWDERPMLVACMFNPSTADHKVMTPRSAHCAKSLPSMSMAV